MRDAFLRWGFVAALTLARIAFGYQFQSLASMGPELMAQSPARLCQLGHADRAGTAPGIFVALPGGMLGRRFGERVVVGIGSG